MLKTINIAVTVEVDPNHTKEDMVTQAIEYLHTYIREEGTEGIMDGVTISEIDAEPYLEVQDEEPIARPTHNKYKGIHINHLTRFCSDNDLSYVHTDSEAILRMRCIMSIRAAGLEDMFLSHFE